MGSARTTTPTPIEGLTPRGSLIVLEGGDKSGKSTHAKLLHAALEEKGIKSKTMSFPARDTEIGQIINSYLAKGKEMCDQTIHLLFSANRWELEPQIKKALTDGVTLIVDRYAFSGVAFSAAKGLDLEWCRHPDVGLPRPDVVLYLNLTPENASTRGDFGGERYEAVDFQEKVGRKYLELYDPEFWQTVNSDRPQEEVHADLLNIAISTIRKNQESPLPKPLWT